MVGIGRRCESGRLLAASVAPSKAARAPGASSAGREVDPHYPRVCDPAADYGGVLHVRKPNIGQVLAVPVKKRGSSTRCTLEPVSVAAATSAGGLPPR